MDQSKKDSNRLPVIPKWSELCPDLLRSVFERLSFTNLNRAKSVCRSWNSASSGCVPNKQNQIPWLIIFPRENETNSSNSCVLIIPDDKDKVYKTRDLGLDFAQSSCLATYGSWFLMMHHYLHNLYILNPLTLERIDLPNSLPKFHSLSNIACLWIDDITKDYLVVWNTDYGLFFTKKGYETWRDVHASDAHRRFVHIFYNHKDHKVYSYVGYYNLYVWDFSIDDDVPRRDVYTFNLQRDVYYVAQNCKWLGIHFATTVIGQILFVETHCIDMSDLGTWQFRVFKLNPLMQTLVKIDSLDDDEALILDMGLTVVTKDIPGIKKNSIYFSGLYHPNKIHNRIFVYDLTTHTMERLPQFEFFPMPFSHVYDARWFFPDFTG